MRKLLILTFLLLVALPATASAQATRTWVSGVGDDANPCSRTAPCKTWAGAQPKTATGGEINAIDTGGFGTITITKSLTLDGNGTQATTTACGTQGVLVNAPTNAKVALRDFRINGCRDSANPGLNGVRVLSAGVVRIDNLRVYGFSNAGFALEPSHLKARVMIQDTSIHDNGAYGIFARPSTGGNLRTSVVNTSIDDNGNGILSSSAYGPSKVRVFDSVISESAQSTFVGFGLWSAGADSSVRVGDSRIVGNLKGLHQSDSGTMLSYGGNIVDDNNVDGTFTGSVLRK
ncbi:MAG TPA: right-handed parallel beta-helix repeat-containing protein [Solirubrobacteraceae bacterium]|jgi:hypothetical protein